MRNKRIRRAMAMLAMTGMMLLNMAPFAVYANVSESDIAAEDSGTVSEDQVKDDPLDLKIPEGPLTPDGNLTIIDDYGSPDKTGKQFITVSSKNGNIFYIIIDRDDKGENTVHFLNLVDERDILSLMDEEEIEEIYGAKEEPVIVEPEPEIVEEEPETAEPEPEKKSLNLFPVFAGFIIIGGGAAIYAIVKGGADKKKQTAYPDPDADYEDDDYIDLPEESGDEQDSRYFDTDELDEDIDE